MLLPVHSSQKELLTKEPKAGGNVIELAMISDAVEPKESEYRDPCLPNGPGWIVKKLRSSSKKSFDAEDEPDDELCTKTSSMRRTRSNI
jgi:hypothetical protein